MIITLPQLPFTPLIFLNTFELLILTFNKTPRQKLAILVRTMLPAGALSHSKSYSFSKRNYLVQEETDVFNPSTESKL